MPAGRRLFNIPYHEIRTFDQVLISTIAARLVTEDHQGEKMFERTPGGSVSAP